MTQSRKRQRLAGGVVIAYDTHVDLHTISDDDQMQDPGSAEWTVLTKEDFEKPEEMIGPVPIRADERVDIAEFAASAIRHDSARDTVDALSQPESHRLNLSQKTPPAAVRFSSRSAYTARNKARYACAKTHART